MADFVMPSLGADMEDGTLVEWFVAAGERVEKSQIIAVVETQKGAIDIEVFHKGEVGELKVKVGETVSVGTVLATILTEHDSPEVPRLVKPTPKPEPKRAPEAAPRAAPEVRPSSGYVRAAPAARRRAHQLNIRLSDVTGTGPHGAVTRQDVEQFTTGQTTEPAPVAKPAAVAGSGMRAAIAAAMVKANREIPHYHLTHTLDMKASLDFLEAKNRDTAIRERVLPAALLLKATAQALTKFPALNGTWTDGVFVPADGIHLGVAIHLRTGGLVIPALHHVDRLSLADVMAGLKDLVARARAGRLRSSELTDGTFTVTNLGDQGVEGVLGVIYPPQVALLGFGGIHDRPWAIDGMLAVRPVLQMTLSADHRASDGHVGSRFLNRLERLLNHPEKVT